ncbi:Wadjet anti-phage system protein JetD domain-containing protein [Streptacidiphilus neutrinimicus]|uniref:Wadjet anti-phage system protein JetD domain-containing protein n=1 Tax=Streptacidiphilus neutrinimicus TaxID=105420 RepID=UPI001F40E011|nr:Wadjet anti-phage system protein JetD domain-containing protein [Streptacidiphilus neutrinimicus]
MIHSRPETTRVPLSPRAWRLAAALEDWPRRTLTQDELWQVFAATDPASAMSPTRRSDLADILHRLAGAGLITCSRAQDTSATPALPTRITLPSQSPQEPAAALARTIAWRPELAWAVSMRLTIAQIHVLHAINIWLRDHSRDEDVVPLRERSLEVLGHEKRLDALLNTQLFAPGRLSLDLLRTFRTRPPLPARCIGSGPVLLVVENADTYDTLTRTLAADPGDVGWTAWGVGGAFEASCASAADLEGVRSIAYFGDLDADGLRIPSSAARTAEREGLAPVRPATGLYRLLLDIGIPQPGQPPQPPHRAAELAQWLTKPEAERAKELLIGGNRLAQEAVGVRVLQSECSRRWREGLQAM